MTYVKLRAVAILFAASLAATAALLLYLNPGRPLAGTMEEAFSGALGCVTAHVILALIAGKKARPPVGR